MTQEGNVRYRCGHGGAVMRREVAFRAVEWIMERAAGGERLGVIFFGGNPR